MSLATQRSGWVLRSAALLAFLLVSTAPTLRAGEESKPSPRPNILYIMADDHAAQAISAYGSQVNKTPQIDRLARQGMRFDQCFVTNSICTPSRACILTGKYSHINGVPVFNRFDGSQPTLAKYLQAAGYHTGMIGKWHLGSDPTGFDYWNILPGQGVYHNPVLIEMGQRKKHQGYATDLITDLSIEFLKNCPKDKPFFLMCHHKAPHRPWQPDEKHRQTVRERARARAQNVQRQRDELCHPQRRRPRGHDADRSRSDAGRSQARRRRKGSPQAELKKWKYERYMQDYLACVASIDDNVGRLLDYLDQNGLAENTIVIYTSDQGMFLGDHDWFDKRFMYEESLRMPFLVRWPGHIKPGSVCSNMILNVDFAPMLLAAAGQPVPGDMQGRSFLPLLQGQTPADWRTAMYYRYYHYPQHHRVQPHYGIRTEQFKLIYFNKIDQWELYDLKQDPYELKNLYADPA